MRLMFDGPVRDALKLLAIACSVALAMCSGYLLMATYRRAMQHRYPDWAAGWPNDGAFSVLGYMGTDNMWEELAYATRTRDAADHWLAYDPYIKENRSVRLMVSDFVLYKIMAVPYLFMRDLTSAWILLRFFFCLIWFLSIYAITYQLTSSARLSVFSGIFITCFSYLLTFEFLSYLHWGNGLGANMWILASVGREESVLRLPRPGVNYGIFFLSILLTLKTLRERKFSWAVFGGIFGGLQAYVRFDTWFPYIASLFILTAVLCAKKQPIRHLLISLAIGLIVAIPFVFVNYPMSSDLLTRVIGYDGAARFVVWGFWPYAAGFAASVVFGRRPAQWCVGSVLLAVVAMLNLQLLTGKVILLPFYSYFFGNIFLLFLAASFLPESWRRARGWLPASAALLFAAFLQTASYAAMHYPFNGLPTEYSQALDYLRANTPPDSIVMSLNPEVNMLIPAFTHCKVVLPPAGPYWSDLSTREIIERFRFILRTLKMPADRVLDDAFSTMPQRTRRSYKRGEFEIAAIIDYTFLSYPFDGIRRLWAQAKERECAGIPRFDYDYVWRGVLENRYGSAEKDAGLVKVYSSKSVAIYRRAAP